MLVAEGVIDVAIEAWVNPWDVAAAQVILKEAGGRFSDFDGADRIDSGNVITTNGPPRGAGAVHGSSPE